jgi:signal transduction histidine kinase
MMKWINTLYARLVLLLLVALVLAQFLLFSLVSSHVIEERLVAIHANVLAPRVQHAEDLFALAPDNALARLTQNGVRVDARLADWPEGADHTALMTALGDTLSQWPGSRARLLPVPDSAHLPLPAQALLTAELALRLKDGRFLVFASDFSMAVPGKNTFMNALWLELALRLLTVFVIAAIIALWLVKPLNQIAAAADALGRGLDGPVPAVGGTREFRQVAKAFDQMQARIRSFVAERTRMLAAISHDLRTPLTRALLRLEMMPETPAREKCISDLAELKNMVEATLDFARLDGEASAHEICRVGELIASVATTSVATTSVATPSVATTSVGSTSVGDTSTSKAHESLSVVGEPTQLKRMLQNLYDNAERYGSPPVTWAIEARGDNVVVTLQDAGPGVPEAALERVFEPFFRVEGSRNRDTGGSGLGLAIARDIARRHGGDITLANRAEGGLQAAVTLPRHLK